MNADQSFVLTVADSVTQETTIILANSQSEVSLLISRLPEHVALLTVQNLGVTMTAEDFLKKLTDDGNLNFGNH